MAPALPCPAEICKNTTKPVWEAGKTTYTFPVTDVRTSFNVSLYNNVESGEHELLGSVSIGGKVLSPSGWPASAGVVVLTIVTHGPCWDLQREREMLRRRFSHWPLCSHSLSLPTTQTE